MIKVYIYGCLTCGTRRVATARVKAYAEANGLELSVVNTKDDEYAKGKHLEYLTRAGLSTDKYDAIVIIDDHNPTEITPLIDWL